VYTNKCIANDIFCIIAVDTESLAYGCVSNLVSSLPWQ